MTLPSAPPISLLDVRQELAINNLPFSLDTPEVRRLAVKPSGALSLTDLLGKERGWWGVLHAAYVFENNTYFCGFAQGFWGGMDSRVGAPYFNGSTIETLYAWSSPTNGDGGLTLRFSDGSAIASVPGTPAIVVQIINLATYQVVDQRTLPRGSAGSLIWNLSGGATGSTPTFFTAAGDYAITLKWA